MISCTCSGVMSLVTFESLLPAGAAAPFVGAGFAAAGFASVFAGAFAASSDLQPESTAPEPSARATATAPPANRFVIRITIFLLPLGSDLHPLIARRQGADGVAAYPIATAPRKAPTGVRAVGPLRLRAGIASGARDGANRDRWTQVSSSGAPH